MAKPINGCGIDPVDAKLQRPMNRSDRVVVTLFAPAELPRPANSPCPKSYGRDHQIGVTELSDVHWLFNFGKRTSFARMFCRLLFAPSAIGLPSSSGEADRPLHIRTTRSA